MEDLEVSEERKVADPQKGKEKGKGQEMLKNFILMRSPGEIM